ncbi:hypothetical protein GGF44_004738, partial [Coemansia sp. RSA 1694]
MDIEYLDPTRYDDCSSDSEEEAMSVPPSKPVFVVRLKPGSAAKVSDTVVISLLPPPPLSPPAADGRGLAASQYEQIGIAYAPAAQQSSSLAIGNSSQTNSALARILRAADGVVHVVASHTVPAELQHGW